MKELLAFLTSRASGGVVSWVDCEAAVARFSVDHVTVERVALESGLLPARYLRNRETISVSQQLLLSKARVAVVGCGGLGGFVIEELARLGVGSLTVVDPDRFEDHNLNRQILATPADLDRAKVVVATERVARVNPAVTVTAVDEPLDEANGDRLLADAEVAVDALDNLPARQALRRTCRALGIPLVHGAVAGWFGTVALQMPDSPETEAPPGVSRAERGVEQHLGTPVCAVATVASLETAEVVKLIVGEPSPLRTKSLAIDLREMEFVGLPT